jgi:hypothetical protein
VGDSGVDRVRRPLRHAENRAELTPDVKRTLI